MFKDHQNDGQDQQNDVHKRPAVLKPPGGAWQQHPQISVMNLISQYAIFAQPQQQWTSKNDSNQLLDNRVTTQQKSDQA